MSFTVYGIWEAGKLKQDQIEETTGALKQLEPTSQISSFVAKEESWPCEVGVFDVEASKWPEAVEAACRAFLVAVCRGGAQLGWMMFEGMFNEVADIFSEEWSGHIYAIQGDCRRDEVALAVADTVRRSPEWKQVVAVHRGRVLKLYPEFVTRAIESKDLK